MSASIEHAGNRRTSRHLPVAGPGLALATETLEDGRVLAHVTYCAPEADVGSYARPDEAVALLLDLPDLGSCSAALVVDRAAQREPLGGNWRGPPADAAELDAAAGGWLSVLIGPPPVERPTTLFVRVTLRGLISPPCRVDLLPLPRPELRPLRRRTSEAPADLGDEAASLVEPDAQSAPDAPPVVA